MVFLMSKDEFDRQMDFMFDEPELMLDKMKGHSDLHYGSSHSEHLNRLFTENIPASASFVDKEVMNDSIINAIYYQKNMIYKWLTFDKKLDTMKEKNCSYNTYAFNVKMDDFIGAGIKNSDMKEYQTPIVRVILERDHAAPSGFYLKTAYPNILVKEAELTGNDIKRSEILYTDKLKSNYDKMFYILKNKYPDFIVQHKKATNKNPECIKVEIPSAVYDYIDLFFNNGEPDRITSFSEEYGRQHISLGDIIINDEKNSEIIIDIVDIYEKISHGHNFEENELIPQNITIFDRD